jgi:hypothetical protein
MHDASVFTHLPVSPRRSIYEVCVWAPEFSAQARDVPALLLHADGNATFSLDQTHCTLYKPHQLWPFRTISSPYRCCLLFVLQTEGAGSSSATIISTQVRPVHSLSTT